MTETYTARHHEMQTEDENKRQKHVTLFASKYYSKMLITSLN